MAITRTAWTDDDGTGTTGTVINNAEKTLLYDQIDAALATMVATTMAVSGNGTIGGTLTVGAGNNLWKSGAIAGDTYLYGYGGTQIFLRHASGANYVNSGGAGGLGFINAANTDVLATISNAGLWTWGTYTATTFAAGDKYLVIDASGNVHRSAIGPAS